MRYRRFLPLLTVALSVAVGAGAVSAQTLATAASATSEWEEVPLHLSNPSPSLTVLEIERLAEQAAHRPLPAIGRAVVYTSDPRRPDDAQSILSGHPNPGVRVYKDMPTVPTTTLKDITYGVPVPQGVIPIPIPLCTPDLCAVVIVLYPV